MLGRGTGGLAEPKEPLDFGNSGTGTRPHDGCACSHDITVAMTGDASLSRRPMGRVLNPLKQMGLEIEGDKDKLPLTIRGTLSLVPIVYELRFPRRR